MGLIETFFNWEILVRSFPILLRGLGNTLLLGVAAIFFGSVFGLLLCFVRLYAPKPFQYLPSPISMSSAPCRSWSC